MLESALKNEKVKKTMNWVRKHWTILAVLAIFLLALSVRSYFAYGPAHNTHSDDELLVSGGSDSYYHKRGIDKIVEDHEQFGIGTGSEEMLNYPMAKKNPRPPLYQWSVVLSGHVLAPFSGDLNMGVWYAFIFSTAFWGALTVVPLYFIGAEMFNRKVGLWSALLLAISPGHIERSVLTNADHDAFALFFGVLCFYFFMKALMSLKDVEWNLDLKQPKSFVDNARKFLRKDKKAAIYGAMAGIAMGAVGLAWKGYIYVTIVILVYFVFQLLLQRFRNINPFGFTMVMLILTLVGFGAMFPYYIKNEMIENVRWIILPFVLSLAIVAFGFIFSATIKYPWTFILMIGAVLAGIILAILLVAFPNTWDVIITGQGYFIKNKLYDTIAEAQKPEFSRMALSYGPITFFLSLIGVGWAIWILPKRLELHYIFITVWAVSMTYMAATSARFIFNATPVFALMAGWVLVLTIDHLDFKTMMRTYRSVSGFGWAAFKKSVKFRHVMGVLFVAILVLLPNFWYSVDAGIPYESKRDYDKEVYQVMPEFMQPENYDEQNGTLWYFGAFGYSMPIQHAEWYSVAYWTDAWREFAQRDNELPEEERPAFISWWDYGFECVQEGKHPTCADNFQNGYKYTGSFIASQGEEDAIALLIVRVLEGSYYNNGETYPSDVVSILDNNVGAENRNTLRDMLDNPVDYVDQVRDNPDRYDPYDDDLSGDNAKYAAMRVLLKETLDKEELVNLYSRLCDATGYDIRYFAIDSRLIPFPGQESSIFYAPIKLSDHRIVQGQPVDYYELIAVTDQGEYRFEDIPEGASIVDYKKQYTDMFYNTMLYRCYFGYNGEWVGAEEGMPSIDSALQQYPPMPAWNMTHWRSIYRTMYWNPNDDFSNHTDDWRAVSVEKAYEYGEEDRGVSMPDYIGLYSGVSFIEYYEGAFLNGTVTTESGAPVPGVRVTVQDEYGIPHHTVKTNKNGRYTLLLPFGNCTVTVTSGGTVQQLTQTEGTELNKTNINVTRSQSAREKEDLDNDGEWDYNIVHDFVVDSGKASGRIYVDINQDDTYTATSDKPLKNTEILFENDLYDLSFTVSADKDGNYELEDIPLLSYDITCIYNGTPIVSEDSAKVGTNTNKDFLIKPAKTYFYLKHDNESIAKGITVSISNESLGSYRNTSNVNGVVKFLKLLPGTYTLDSQGDYVLEMHEVELEKNETLERAIHVLPKADIRGMVSIGSKPIHQATVNFESSRGYQRSVDTDTTGNFHVTLPNDVYKVYTFVTSDDGIYSNIISDYMDTEEDLDISLERSHLVQGNVIVENESMVRVQLDFLNEQGGTYKAFTNSSGDYRLYLPSGTFKYQAYVEKESQLFVEAGSITVDGARDMDLELVPASRVRGKTYEDINTNNQDDVDEYLSGVLIDFVQGGKHYWANSVSGDYDVIVQSNESYQITATKEGFATFTDEADILSNETQVLVDLTAQLVTLTGSITKSTADLVEADITFENLYRDFNTTVRTVGKQYTVELPPGNYLITVDERVHVNDTDLMDQYKGTFMVGYTERTLEHSFDLIRRARVYGQILGADPNETAELFFFETEEASASTDDLMGYELYLRPGAYDVQVVSSKGSVNLTRIGVSGTGKFDFILVPGANVTIKGTSTQGLDRIPLRITDKTTGYGFNYTYKHGVNNTIVLEDNQPYKAVVDIQNRLGDDGKYYTYTYKNNGFTPHSPTYSLSLNVKKTEMQALVEGTAHPNTDIIFTGPTSSTVTVDANGSYTVELKAGNYSVYSSYNDRVVFKNFDVTPEQTLNLDRNVYDLEYVTGNKLEGVIYFVNTSNVTKYAAFDSTANMVDTVLRYDFTTELDGSYAIILPDGAYDISSTGSQKEYNITVNYAGEETIQLASPTTLNIEMEKNIKYKVSLELISEEGQLINAGEEQKFFLRVTNKGNTETQFNFTSAPSDWNFRFSNYYARLDVGESFDFAVVVMTPEDAIVDHEDIKITAKSVDDATVSSSVTVDLNIRQTYGLELETTTQQVSVGIVEHEFELRNTGNGEDVYSISLENLVELENAGWNVSVQNTAGAVVQNLTLAPNITETLAVVMKGFGTSLPVSILVESESDLADETLDMEPIAADFQAESSQLKVSGEPIQEESVEALIFYVASIVFLVLFILLLVLGRILKPKTRRDRRRRREGK